MSSRSPERRAVESSGHALGKPLPISPARDLFRLSRKWTHPSPLQMLRNRTRGTHEKTRTGAGGVGPVLIGAGVVAILTMNGAACRTSRSSSETAATSAEGRSSAPGPSSNAPGAGGPGGSSAGDPAQALPKDTLKVCADPNNLPMSNRKGEGYENAIAELLARDLGLRLEYVWWAQRRGFIRHTLKTGACDLMIELPTSSEMALTSAPYFRSGYVFVSRHDRRLSIRSLDDPVLKRLRIGVQMIGNDYANSPPAHALARRGIVNNVVGYSVLGDYTTDSPPSRIVEAVANGRVDVAIVWGPLAGYFAKRQRTRLDLVPVTPQVDIPFLPFAFDMSFAVRRGETALLSAVEDVAVRRRAEIDSILDRYGVPRMDRSAG